MATMNGKEKWRLLARGGGRLMPPVDWKIDNRGLRKWLIVAGLVDVCMRWRWMIRAGATSRLEG